MKSIILKYLEGRATGTEQKKLMIWLKEKENLILFRKYKSEWKTDIEGKNTEIKNREIWDRINFSLFRKSFEEWQKTTRWFSIFKYAAVFFMVLSLMLTVYLFSDRNVESNVFTTTVVADNGQISKIILPDSSIVWLNSGTTLSYSNYYALDNRDLKLNGEAWFIARRNETLPMVVDCSGLFVKVLGTSFNVSAYEGYWKISVVLEEGAVDLYKNLKSNPVCSIIPGEMAEFNRKDRRMIISKVNTVKYSSWKEGMINFYKMPLEDVAIRLEKRYNQQFIIDEKIKNSLYTFTIRNENLEVVLKDWIENITPVTAIQNNDVIILKYDENKAKRFK